MFVSKLTLAALVFGLMTPILSLSEKKSHKINGVNLNGWLLIEPWVTPTLFEKVGSSAAVDEYTFTQILGSTEAKKRLEYHWSTFITLDDFIRIKNAGLNHVRIPIGYWAIFQLHGEPYVQGQLKYLDKALNWAKETGLKILIDLHGAPGSQNGLDSSGHRGTVGWQQGDTVKQTLHVIDLLSRRYATHSNVVAAISLLNAPEDSENGVDLQKLKQFYVDGAQIVRDIKDTTTVVIDSAFQPITSWDGFLPDFDNLLVDTHNYQIFSDNEVARDFGEQIHAVCTFGIILQSTEERNRNIVGEWSGALTDCAKNLNGRGIGSRYDGSYPGSHRVGSCVGRTGPIASFSMADKIKLRGFIEAQLDAYELGDGWIFCTWKTESAGEWSMQQLLAYDLFPQPITSRIYPGQCSA